MPLDWLAGSHEESIADLIVRKRYGRAIELLKLHLQRQGRSTVVRLQLADTLVMAGRSAEAVPIFLGLADEFAADGFMAKAVAALKRVEKIEPGRPDVEARLKALARQQQVPPRPSSASSASVASARHLEIGIEEVGPETWTRLQSQARREAAPTAPPGPPEAETGPTAVPVGATDVTPAADDEPLRMASVAAGSTQEETPPPAAAAASDGVVEAASLAKAGEVPTTPTATAVVSDHIRGAFRRFLALLPVPAAAGVTPELEGPPALGEAGPAVSTPGESSTSAKTPSALDAGPSPEVEALEPLAADEDLPTLGIEEPPETESNLVASPSAREDEDLPTMEIEDTAEEAVTPLPVALEEDQPTPAPIDEVSTVGVAPAPSEESAQVAVDHTGPRDFLVMPDEVFQEQVTDLIEEFLHPAESAPPGPDAASEVPSPAPPIPLLAGPLLEDLTEEERLSFLQGLRLRSVETGDIILTEGEAGQSLFLLTTGKVKVFVRDPAGHNVVVGSLGEGDVFGEIAVLHGRPRTATITAAARGELLELDQESLARLAQDHPRVVARIEAFSRERIDDQEAAAVRAGARSPAPAEAGASRDLDAHFGSERLEPRMRLRLADAFLKAGEDRRAVQILIDLADDLVQRRLVEKAVALLKKVEEIQLRRTGAVPRSAGERPPSLPDQGPLARPDSPAASGDLAVSDRFQDWLLDLVRDTVRRRPSAAEEPTVTAGRLDADALRAYGRGLIASRLFQGLSEEELLAVIRGLRLLTFEAGDIVLTEGEAGESVFILATGRVKVFVRNRSGQDVAIDELGEGAFFGEMAAISIRSRAATVTAASACTLLELDGPALRAISQSYPAVREVLEHVFIERATDPRAASVRGREGHGR